MRCVVIVVVVLSGLLAGCAGLGLYTPEQQALLTHADPRLAAAVRAHPDQPEPWYQLGNGYAKHGRPGQAAAAYREALRHGSYPRAEFNLGLMQVWQGVRTMRTASRKLPREARDSRQMHKLLQLLEAAGLGA